LIDDDDDGTDSVNNHANHDDIYTLEIC